MTTRHKSCVSNSAGFPIHPKLRSSGASDFFYFKRKRKINGRIETATEVCHNIHEAHRYSPGVSVSFARILFDDKVETPAVYWGKQNKGVWKSKEEFSNPYNWSGYIVGNILSKPEYMGDTVNFRSHKKSYKDKHSVKNPKDEWMIFENTHEAIVDRETWELAQKLRKTPRRHDTLGEANPLTGLLFCADCGEKMLNHRSRGGTENNPYPSDFYDCSTYTGAPKKDTCLLRTLYHDKKPSYPYSGHDPYRQHLCDFQPAGISGKGAGSVAAPTGGSGEGYKEKAEQRP